MTFGYTRISIESERGLGLEDQATRIRSYCLERNLGQPEILVDNGVSGKVPMSKRPAGGQLATAKDCTVVALRLDRLFRSLSDMLVTVEAWNRRGVSLHIISFMGGQAVDTQSPQGRLMLQMLGAFAEFERGIISERIRAALAVKRARGEKLGRFQPYNGPGLSIILDRPGVAGVELARHLNQLGIVSPGGKLWTSRAVERIRNRQCPSA